MGPKISSVVSSLSHGHALGGARRSHFSYLLKSGTHCFGGGDPLFQSWDPLGWLSVRPRTHLLKFVNKTLKLSDDAGYLL